MAKFIRCVNLISRSKCQQQPTSSKILPWLFAAPSYHLLACHRPPSAPLNLQRSPRGGTKYFESHFYRTLMSMEHDLKKDDRIIWIDLEMTGLDVENDKILEIASIITEKNLSVVAEGPNLILHQSDDVLNRMNDWCIKHHGESGLTEASQKSKLELKEAEQLVLDFVRQHTPEGLCPLGGNSVSCDKEFLARYMPELVKHLHYRIIDVSSVKELCRRWYPKEFKSAPVKKLCHRAMDDIKETIEELKFYQENIFK